MRQLAGVPVLWKWNTSLIFAVSIVEDDEIFVNIGVKIDFTNAIRYNIVDCHIGGE